MKHRVSSLLLAATTLLAAPAWAAPVFMLQFGSFETREEAQQRLTELQGKHGGVLSSMSMNIREVTLPPDNLTVYRTQAGPVESRASAQSVCSQLASNGDECYVVETAMLPQTGTAMVAGSSTAPLAAPPVALTGAPARDAGSVAMMNAVTSTPAPAAAAKPVAEPSAEPTAPAASPKASPALQQAMNDAAAEQEAAAAAAPTPAGAKPEGSFWSRLNPFSSSEPAAAPMPTPKPAMAATSAPASLPSLEQQAAATPPLAPLPPQDVPMVAQRKDMVAQAAPAPAPAAPAPMAMATPAPAPAASMQLPPPPAPLIGKGAINDSTAASLRAPTPAAMAAPQAAGSLPVASQPAPLVVPPPASAPVAVAGTNNVTVGEAKRVPLSTMSPVLLRGQQMDASRAPIASQLPQIPPPVSLSPNATLGEKTLWAQIGLFKDAQDALAYWAQYRQTHPDFPVVRVRVNNNYQAALRGHPEVSLRVGPFAREGALRHLCASIREGERELRCGTVVDMGMAGQINGPREGFLSGSRYRR